MSKVQCCCLPSAHAGGAGGLPSGNSMSLPILCLIPRNPRDCEGKQPQVFYSNRKHMPESKSENIEFMDEEYLKKHFNLPPRALYLDPKRRPLITFPMTQEDSKNFNLARKYKINQQILDGILDPSAAISAPNIFPYAESETSKTSVSVESDEDEEIIYIVQLPDFESKCPLHNEAITTPRFIWHACKKAKSDIKDKKCPNKLLSGPPKKPKPWLLSRHTDFDLLSQW